MVNTRGLGKYKVACVLVPLQRALTNELARSDKWREIFRNENAGVRIREK